MKYIPELTGLRGLAVLLVFISHAFKDGLIPGGFGISYGTQGVLLFFTLSGYLMGRIYLEQKFNSQTVLTYALARIGRVFPLYIAVLILSFLISRYIYADFRYDFTNSFKFILALLFVKTPYELWSIPIEVQFYLCFILFWYFYSKEKKNKLILFLIPALIFLPSLLFFILKHRALAVMPTFSLFFFSGILISILKSKAKAEVVTNKIPVLFSWLILILYLLNLSVLEKIFGLNNIPRWLNIYSVVLLFVFFTLIVLKPQDFGIFKSKFMLFIGKISFGLYVIHRPIMEIMVSYNWDPILTLLLTFALTIGLAFLIYRFFEIPLSKLISKKI